MTWSDLFTALGLVAVIEGLVLALAPSRLDEVLRALAALPVAQRRTLGLAAVAAGVLIVSLASG